MVYEFFEWDKISTALLAGTREESERSYIKMSSVHQHKDNKINKSKSKKITEKKQKSLPHPLNLTGLSIEDLHTIWAMEHLL